MKSSLSAGRALTPALAILLGACAQTPMTLPGPLEFQRSPQAQAATISEAGAPRAVPETTVAVMPSPNLKGVAAPAAPAVSSAPGAADSEEVSMAIEQTPLPMFIQILYGNVLKRPYSIDPAINARTDVVTFKTSRPLSRARLAELAVALLDSYQIAVQDLDGLIRIVPANVRGRSAVADAAFRQDAAADARGAAHRVPLCRARCGEGGRHRPDPASGARQPHHLPGGRGPQRSAAVGHPGAICGPRST